MGKGDKKAHNRKAGKRTPSGRLSRAKDQVAQRQQDAERQAFEEGPQQTVLKARRRHRQKFREPANPDAWREEQRKPVSKPQAKKQRLDARGSVLGRMWADGQITDQQRAAGDNYCARYLRYAALNGMPRVTPKVGSYGEVTGGSRAERLDAAMAAKAEHDRDQAILRHCTAGVRWAMKRACVTDEAAPAHLVKEGLQALVDEDR